MRIKPNINNRHEFIENHCNVSIISLSCIFLKLQRQGRFLIDLLHHSCAMPLIDYEEYKIMKLTEYLDIIESNPTFKKSSRKIRLLGITSAILWLISILILMFQTMQSADGQVINFVWGLSLISAVLLSLIAKKMKRKLIIKIEKEHQKKKQ